jgi:DNA helicase HerA-like ATPase
MSTPNRQQHVRLDIDRDGLLPLTKDRLIGTSITILGRKGTGKSTTLAVLAEELLKERVPLVLVDPRQSTMPWLKHLTSSWRDARRRRSFLSTRRRRERSRSFR